MDKLLGSVGKQYLWTPPVEDTPSPLPYVGRSPASQKSCGNLYSTCEYPKSKDSKEQNSPGPSGSFGGGSSKMYKIQAPRVLSSPAQSLVAPNKLAYIYTWRLPTPEVIADLAGVDADCFSDPSQTIGLVFSRPISQCDYVCRIPLYLKRGMVRARVTYEGPVRLNQSECTIVMGAHVVLAELLTDILHHRISTSSKSDEDTPFSELRFDPPGCLVLAVLTIVGMNSHVPDIEACKRLVKWQRNRKAPDSSVDEDFHPERDVISAYPVKLNQLPQRHWKGRLVRSSTLPQADSGVFACSSPCGDLIVKCYRLTRHLNAAQVTAGFTPSKKTLSLKALDFEAKNCVVYPLSAWLFFVLSLVPVVTYQITRALLSLEMAQSFASHLVRENPPPSCTVLLPDRLDAPKCMLRDLRCSTASDKAADEKDNLKIWDENASSDIFYQLKIPNPRDLIQATTFLGASDAVNLERLEFLGDASLELFATLNVFENFPEDADEGQLTAERMKLITNDRLLKIADKFNWPIYCTSRPYSPEDCFLPPCYTVSHLGQDDPHFFVQLFNKPIADMVEALLASFLTIHGVQAAYKFAKYYGIVECKLDGHSSMWSRILTDVDGLLFQFSSLNFDDSREQSLAENKTFLLRDSSGHQRTSFHPVERVLGYHFNNDGLLFEALTHGSYERLEFLGDAVLGFVVSISLYNKYPDYDPGQLTVHRKLIVQNSTLVCATIENGIHEHIKHSVNGLEEFSSILMAHQLSGVSYEEQNNIACREGYGRPVKIYADVFEALLGAVFADSEGDLNVATRVVHRLLGKRMTLDMDCWNQPIRVQHGLGPSCHRRTTSELSRLFCPDTGARPTNYHACSARNPGDGTNVVLLPVSLRSVTQPARPGPVTPQRPVPTLTGPHSNPLTVMKRPNTRTDKSLSQFFTPTYESMKGYSSSRISASGANHRPRLSVPFIALVILSGFATCYVLLLLKHVIHNTSP